MTVSTTENLVIHNGNGVATEFPFYFPVLELEHLIVQRKVLATGEVDTTYTTSQYTVAGIGNAAGGTLTLSGSPLSASYALIIQRIVPYTQETDIINQAGFYPDTVEERFDLIVMQVQQLAKELGRSIRIPASDGLALDPLDVAEERANKYLTFDADGVPSLSSGTGSDADLRDDLALSNGASLVGYTQSGTGSITRSVQSILRAMHVTPLDYGAVGNGTADDTTPFQNALDSGRDVYLPAGYTFRHTVELSVTTDYQRIMGPGVIKPDGAINGLVIEGASTGAEVAINVDSAVQSAGYALKIANASRVLVHRLHAPDCYGALYVEECNVCTVDWLWATCRGPGIKWYGDDTTRSDILHLNNVVVQPGDGFYGLDWDGNCHTMSVTYVGIVCGGTKKGFIIRNTAGVSTFPAIGRFKHIEIDYPSGHGIQISAGLDYDFIGGYVLGATSDGYRIDAAINDYEVRITGGKSVGNVGYGINAAGGVVLMGGATTLYDNTAGNTTGDVWDQSPQFRIDTDFYMTLDGGSDPIIGFDPDDYLGYDRSANVFRFFVGANEIVAIDADSVDIGTARQLKLASGTTARAPLNFGAGVAPSAPANGDIWNDGADLKVRLAGVTYTIQKA